MSEVISNIVKQIEKNLQTRLSWQQKFVKDKTVILEKRRKNNLNIEVITQDIGLLVCNIKTIKNGGKEISDFLRKSIEPAKPELDTFFNQKEIDYFNLSKQGKINDLYTTLYFECHLEIECW